MTPDDPVSAAKYMQEKLDFMNKHDGASNIGLDSDELKKHRMVVVRCDMLQALLATHQAVDIEAVKQEIRQYFNAFAPEHESRLHKHGDNVVERLHATGRLK